MLRASGSGAKGQIVDQRFSSLREVQEINGVPTRFQLDEIFLVSLSASQFSVIPCLTSLILRKLDAIVNAENALLDWL